MRKRCPNGTRRNKKTGLCETKKIKSFRSSLSKKSFLRTSIKSSNLEDKGAKKIQKFMLQNKNKIRALFLNTICSDAGSCIALGTNSDKIKKFFGGFVDFSYLINISKIGKVSANGAVFEFEYSHRDYKSHAILKMNSRFGSDSLLYEYFVGIRINHFAKYFPNFLETYGSYTINQLMWNKIIKGLNFTKPELIENFKLNPYNDHDIAGSCNLDYHKIYAILIQHLKVKRNEETLSDCMNFTDFINNELAYVLFQIYSTLSALANEYTHYDLHTENVMMYVPNEDKYIEYHYHYPDGKKIIFKSKYIVKIIDYGRNYINVDGMPENSRKFYQQLCALPKCNKAPTKCGNSFGYNFFDPLDNVQNFYIVSSEKNISHDLRLAKILSFYFKNDSKIQTDNPYLFAILSAIKYDTDYGTPELSTGLPKYVNNVNDMDECLKYLITKSDYISKNDAYYSGKIKMGELHVYVDMSKPMSYESF
uniref:Protein kinase domain-containing protein n=1 Tax=viral metagenome TaxID=1070528 RepID=A0A6C0HZ76_9ZZZZ